MKRLDKYGRPLKFTYVCKMCYNEISYMQLRKHMLEHGIDIVRKTNYIKYLTEQYYEVTQNDI